MSDLTKLEQPTFGDSVLPNLNLPAGTTAVPPRLPPLVHLLIVAGLALSLGLVYVHVRTYLSPEAESFCSLSQRFDCIAVSASRFSVVLGLPWALWGVVGFFALQIAALRRAVWLLPLSLLSAFVSLFLLGISLWSVGSLCYLCEATHLVCWALAYLVVRHRGALAGSYADWAETTNIFAAPFGLVLALWVFVPNYWAAFTYYETPPFPSGTTQEGYPWIGAANPKITLHEYVDYTCPHCRARSTQTLRQLSKHPELRLVRRQQPRMRCDSKYPLTCQYVRMALCAQEQDKFWQADRWLFAHVDYKMDADSEQLVRDLKLDKSTFFDCINSEASFRRAQAEAQAATRSKITFVPAHTVDGKRLKPEELAKLLD